MAAPIAKRVCVRAEDPLVAKPKYMAKTGQPASPKAGPQPPPTPPPQDRESFLERCRQIDVNLQEQPGMSKIDMTTCMVLTVSDQALTIVSEKLAEDAQGKNLQQIATALETCPGRYWLMGHVPRDHGSAEMMAVWRHEFPSFVRAAKPWD